MEVVAALVMVVVSKLGVDLSVLIPSYLYEIVPVHDRSHLEL